MYEMMLTIPHGLPLFLNWLSQTCADHQNSTVNHGCVISPIGHHFAAAGPTLVRLAATVQFAETDGCQSNWQWAWLRPPFLAPAGARQMTDQLSAVFWMKPLIRWANIMTLSAPIWLIHFSLKLMILARVSGIFYNILWVRAWLGVHA